MHRTCTEQTMSKRTRESPSNLLLWLPVCPNLYTTMDSEATLHYGGKVIKFVYHNIKKEKSWGGGVGGGGGGGLKTKLAGQ